MPYPPTVRLAPNPIWIDGPRTGFPAVVSVTPSGSLLVTLDAQSLPLGTMEGIIRATHRHVTVGFTHDRNKRPVSDD